MPKQKIKPIKEANHHRQHLVRYQHEEIEIKFSTSQHEKDVVQNEQMSNALQKTRDFTKEEKSKLRNISIDMRIFGMGCILMLITGLPNFNLALASSISGSSGILSSALFGIGGSLGGFQKQWKYLYIAGILQVITIAFICIETEWDERYQRLEEDSYVMRYR
ncbi:predicted protein [Chaetoceros tenuissimus]|uniref:Uncharacterized protein n=1 Tax=Chaetoceros tenuissimus TaxID=426638 RepID=A0AAD3D7X1_9STRA|nr:predicted protein [Chaetoceros tenuissimus]